MRKLVIFPLLSVTVLAAGITLECSNLIPDPETTVILWVKGAPQGASFRWDLDGDGRFETTTSEPEIRFVVGSGSRTVTVEVTSAGKSLGQASLTIVADPRLGAIRTITKEDGSFLVTLMIQAKMPLIAPGIAEDIPQGAVVEVVAEGGAFWRKAEKLEAVWPLILDPGSVLAFSYRVYSTAEKLRLSGVVSGYVGGQRVEIPIAGQLQP
jgi:acylphosphatase